MTDISLPYILDILWQGRENKEILAKKLCSKLNSIDLTILAGWDSAATFGPASGIITFDFPSNFRVTDKRGIIIVEAALVDEDTYQDDRRCLIKYIDTSLSVVGISLPPYVFETSLNHSFPSLLVGLQLIRDYLDSVLLHPRDQRRKYIQTFAEWSGLDVDYFQRLNSWYTEISSFIFVNQGQ